jgi:Rad9
MDLILPSHSVRPFCSAIASLGKVGKDIYLEFDPVHGLDLRTMNDAKSAYACFHYDATFFERCTVSTSTALTTKKRNYDESSSQTSTPSSDSSQYSCRVACRALAAILLRPRKNVHSLRIVSTNSDTVAALIFEFTLQRDQLVTATHRIYVAENVVGVTAVAPKDNASEIVSSAAVLWNLLEPLQTKTASTAALIVRPDSVSASSFYHHSNGTQNTNSSNNNAILQATSASLTKSETACGSDEFLEFDFISNRDTTGASEDMPDNVNSEVILVFPIKETKSLLQFGTTVNSATGVLMVHMNFHWGGKPLVFEAMGESFTAQLVLATLDYTSLESMRTTENQS